MDDSSTPAVVSYRRDGEVALICIANPPVNALSHAVRRALLAALARLAEDPQAKAAVLCSSGRAFIAGADVTEFRGRPAPPLLPRVVAALDASAKPIVAALDGVALGGGLELALACSHRLAGKGARLGFPEVKLGLLPGAGGTQRLPRLVGIERALELITTGAQLDAGAARKLGIVDELVADDEMPAAAIAAATRLARQAEPPRRLSALAVDGAGAKAALAAATKRASSSRLAAPRRIVQAVAASLKPFEAGLRRERQLFLRCRRSRQHQALLHRFLAQRAAAAVEASPSARIARVAVVGAGTMGAGIAACFADAGLPALMLEADERALAAGLGRIDALYAARVRGGRLAPEEARRRRELVSGGGYEDLAAVDLVVEAVPEELELKREVFARLGRHAGADTILATNTSGLDIDALAAASGRPAKVVGMHFFVPAQRMPLLEVVPGRATDASVHAAVVAAAKRIGKAPVTVGNCPGFVGNRLYGHYGREAELLLEEGATPTAVDAALVRFGMAMGPFAARDLSGNDVGLALRRQQWAGLPASYPRPQVLKRLVAAGRLGQKSGAGYYRYEAGSRRPLADRAVLAHIRAAAAARGVRRGRVAAAHIVERCILALVNEGAKALEDGAARRASDIDHIFVAGYGFPAWRGGPMYHADSLGLDVVHGRVSEFHRARGPWWEPAPLLARLARDGGSFAELDAS